MKLIYCKKCLDVVALRAEKRSCICGASYGYYKNDIDAVIGGDVIPLGFANSSFVKALCNQPKDGMGHEFVAFVIPKSVDSITYDTKNKEHHNA